MAVPSAGSEEIVTSPETPPVVVEPGQVHPAQQRLDEEKAALKARVDELESKLKASEIEKLPEDKQAEAEFRQLAAEQALAQIPPEVIAKLPAGIQKRLREDPFQFVSQKEIDRDTRFAETLREKSSIMRDLAVKSISEMVGTVTTPTATPEDKQTPTDPTIAPGGGAGPDPINMSQGELAALAWTDPARFEQIHRSLRK